MTQNSTEQNTSSAKIYGQSGALKDLLRKIADPKIKTLEDVLQFRKNQSNVRRKMVTDSVAEIKLQISKMVTELNQLKHERDEAIKVKKEEQNQTIACLESELIDPHQRGNFFTAFYSKITRWAQEKKIKKHRKKSQKHINAVTNSYAKRVASMADKINNTNGNIQALAEKRISIELRKVDDINSAIEKEKYLFYGAIGEARVLDELKKLPEAYHIINDFRLEFNPPLYNRSEDDRIYSIQADHLVVGPTGVFVTETKYWSNKSISNDMLFSPIKQVKRVGFALFVLLNDAIKDRHIPQLVNNWGERKISPRQIVASVNSVPHADFQYVKVLGIEKLNSYITYGKQEFTTAEIQDIVDFLLRCQN